MIKMNFLILLILLENFVKVSGLCLNEKYFKIKENLISLNFLTLTSDNTIVLELIIFYLVT